LDRDHEINNNWADFQLLDSGNGYKLEKWGSYILIRPETVAIWQPRQSMKEWKNKAHAIFEYNNKRTGTWKKLKKMPNDWTISYDIQGKILTFFIELTRFKHVGLFPEQAENWEYLVNRLSGVTKPKVLNLFAYTGGATLAAKAAGADVTHVDAIKQVITWTNKNMQLSKLDGARWIVEDALKFVQKDLKRGTKYDLIVMDPPTWGLGPKGEKWKLEDKLDDLLKGVKQILKEKSTLIMNTYSGITPGMMRNVCQHYFPKARIYSNELMLSSKTGSNIPTGTVVRIEL